MCCCNQDPQGRNTSCLRMVPTSLPKTVLVGDENTCARSLPILEQPSLLVYNSNGRVAWSDGSSSYPIELPNIQNAAESATLIGQDDSGNLVAVSGTSAGQAVPSSLNGAVYAFPSGVSESSASPGSSVTATGISKEAGRFGFGGDPDTTYSVTIRIRGIVETAAYANGTQNGYLYTGGNPTGTYNQYAFMVYDPFAYYFLNAGSDGPVVTGGIDYTLTFNAKGGTTFRIYGDDRDGTQYVYKPQPTIPDDDPLHPLVIGPGYFGQWVQIDIISVT